MSDASRRLRLLVLAAVALLVLPASAGAGVRVTGIDTTHYPTIRATVYSSAGAARRPSITEEGTPVAALEATNLAASKSIVLAIDRSQSMRGRSFADAIGAARAFVAAEPATDRIEIVAFGSGVTGLSRFSAGPDAADAALAGLSVDSHEGTALYDAVDYASRQLATKDGGRVLIVLTDGRDTTSKHTLQGVADAAQSRNVLIEPIAIAGPSYDPSALEQLAAETGGTFHRASSSSSLGAVYRSIAKALRHTWRISYLTAASPGDDVHLQAAVAGAGTGSDAGKIPSSFGASGTPAPSKLVPTAAYGPTGPIAVGTAVGVLLLLAFVVSLAAYRGSWVKGRITPHLGDSRATSRQKRRERRVAALSTVFGVTERAFGHLRQWRAVQRMLERADVPLRTVEFFWIMVGSAFVFGLLAAVAGQSPIVILVMMLLAGSAPFTFVWLKMRRRLRAFENQLADLLVTIAASLKAGHSFKQGLQAVVDEGLPPASDEFKRVLTETSLGRPMDEALSAMAERVGSKNFEFAITAVTIQRQIGGSLAGLFDMVADTVRQRQQFTRKIRGLTAMGRMSSYTLMGLPFFIAGMITLINPEYMSPLYHTHAGNLMIIGGLVMMATGSALLKKIVSFRG